MNSLIVSQFDGPLVWSSLGDLATSIYGLIGERGAPSKWTGVMIGVKVNFFWWMVNLSQCVLCRWSEVMIGAMSDSFLVDGPFLSV